MDDDTTAYKIRLKTIYRMIPPEKALRIYISPHKINNYMEDLALQEGARTN